MRTTLVLLVLLVACMPVAEQTMTPQSGTPSPAPPTALRYVALGDSYTIGTGVGREERWPDQLVERLSARGVKIELLANLGVNGYTSGDLLDNELPQVAGLRPDFVSVLVGVNDVVQGVPASAYRANVVEILGALLGEVPRERLVVVSTPDYTRTPRGADFGNPEAQRAGIAEVNRIMREEASARGIAFVDIGPVADRVGADPDLVASDQLHPSGAQYALWVDLIDPVVMELLSESPE